MWLPLMTDDDVDGFPIQFDWAKEGFFRGTQYLLVEAVPSDMILICVLFVCHWFIMTWLA